MKFLTIPLLVLAALGLASCDESSSGFDIDKVDKSVVRVALIARNTQTGKSRYVGGGTGFVIAPGIVVTNDHVAVPRQQIPQGIQILLAIPDGSLNKLRQAKILWTSKPLDLAVLQVPGLNRPAVAISQLGSASMPKKGAPVIAVGFPAVADRSIRGQGLLVSTVTRGIVGKVGMAAGPQAKLRKVIQHSAPINQGNSGGPLFNECHHVIGVNTFITLQSFRIVKDQRGQTVARGAASAGHFYSSHSESLVNALRTVPALRNISFPTASATCKVSAGGLPVFAYILIAVLAILAMSALGLAIFKKGGTREVIKVVESYSQWVRRKGPDGQGGGAGGDATRKGGAVAGVTRKPESPRTARTGATGPTQDGAKGWVLSGFDGEGNVVRLEIAEDELKAEEGIVIGRSKSQADKILADGSVSRQHARLTLEGDKLMLTDLESAYGTSIGDTKLEPGTPTEVPASSKVSFGSVSLEISPG